MTESAGTAELKADEGMIATVGGWGTTHRPRQKRRWLLLGERAEPTPGSTSLYEPPGDHVGICCSGGGIRSAAFNLGALQVLLGDEAVRTKTKYLSAVSGGSYIASALCTVAKRWHDEPNGQDSDPNLVTKDALPFGPGSPEEQYLRNHLAYLAPDGIAKVYLALRMWAGLTVNVLLIGLPVFIVGLLIGIIGNGPYHGLADGNIHVPLIPLLLFLVLGGLALVLAMLDVIWRPRDLDRDTAVRTWEVRVFLAAVLVGVVVIAVPLIASWAGGLTKGKVLGVDSSVWESFFTAWGSMAALAGAAVTHVRGRVRDEQKAMQAAEKKLGKYAKVVRDALISLVVMLAGPLLLVAMCAFGVLVAATSDTAGWVFFGGSVVVLALMWIGVDLTTVSLHPFYRRRLASAFALRRIWRDADGREVPAPGDRMRNGGVAVEERPYKVVMKLSESAVGDTDGLGKWPTLIVCAAANISDPGATPPGRSVASFTFSPTAIGGPLTGATRTSTYEALVQNRKRDVSHPAAVAMSGAALSPSMGKFTFRPITFLLALANIRLGVWVPNPRHINDCAHNQTSTRKVWHRPRPEYLWKELFGRNRLDDKFLYVTDGGHYENLGLMELVRRGCGTIYCFDAGGGGTSKALGDAIALARAELNVEIAMDKDAAALEETKEPPLRSKSVCAKGTIKYPDGAIGELYYIRSVVSETSPWDLLDYQIVDGIFPHHSTFDQFFDDQKFEAYRRLGTCGAQAAMAMDAKPQPEENGAARVTQAKTYSATGRLQLELDE